ncbi:MAG TPA: cytochrome P450 [Streptosporangiaceae bacterium]|nr:cytochrome P450 [Streptosporangiaceae bacterium]
MITQEYLPPRTRPFDPPDMLAELRATAPLTKVTIWDGTKVWLVTQYDAAREVLRDPRFSVDVKNPGFPKLSAGRVSVQPTMSRMDDPRHGEIRRMLADEFLSGRIKKMWPAIARIVDSQIDHLLGTQPPTDFHAEFALPVPTRVIGELLGVPPAEHRTFHEATQVMLSRTATKEEFVAADQELISLCARLLAQKDPDATDDMLSRTIVREMRAGRLTTEEAYHTTKLLIIGGHETSANMISLGTLTMLLNPEWFRQIRDQPEAVSGAVEELLRYHTPMHDGVPRVATDDVVIAGTLIKAGEGVIVSLAAGNRDESEFANPDELEIDRERPRRHLSFGHGAHKCLGQWLARAELQIALAALARRIPTLRPAVPLEEISFKEDSHVFGVHALPLTW